MNILKITFAKLVDKLTILEAPSELNGVIGFNNNASLCLESGFKPVNYSTQAGNTAIYSETDNDINQEWVTIDQEVYSNRTTELIRAQFSIDQELSIHRKRLSHPVEFQSYYDFCEECKKAAKLEQIN